MSDPSGVSSGLGIETVEWSAQSGDTIVLRVTGRWRRRRPTWSGPPALMIEAEGQRHRFPALPEPPSLTGAAPGTWSISFSVPAVLAPHFGGRIWLQLGAVAVPIPVEVVAALGESPVSLPNPGDPQTDALAPARPRTSEPGAEPGLLAERRLRSYELAMEAARRRAAEAEEVADELTARIDELELELEVLGARLAERERARRRAEQLAHSERLLREELRDELAEQLRASQDVSGGLEERAAMEARIAELEAELGRLLRRADEAEQLAAAARSAALRAERAHAGSEPEPAAPVGPRATQPAVEGLPVRAAVLDRPARPLRAATVAVGIRSELLLARSIPPAARTATAPLAPAMSPAPAAPISLAPEGRDRLSEALGHLRRELGELRDRAEGELARRQLAEARVLELERQLGEQASRSRRAYEAVGFLREQVEAIRLGRGGLPLVAPVSPPGGPVSGLPEPGGSHERIDPDRLAAALARLREAAAEHATADERPDQAELPALRPWLADAFGKLAARDGAAAGRLVLALLPALPIAHPGPVSFDLVLNDVGTVQVTAAGAAVAVELADAPRPRAEAAFQVIGDLAGLGRAVASGRSRRRFGRGGTRVRGDRRAFAALPELVRSGLSLRGLHAAGVRLEPALTFQLASLLVDPAWTAGERFTIAHRERGAQEAGTYLHVRDGQPTTVTDASAQMPVATTIVVAASSLLLVLDGAPGTDCELHGDERPLVLLQGWMKRAQSG